MAEESFSEKKKFRIFSDSRIQMQHVPHTLVRISDFTSISNVRYLRKAETAWTLQFYFELYDFWIWHFLFISICRRNWISRCSLCASSSHNIIHRHLRCTKLRVFISHILCRCCLGLCTPFVISKWNFLRLNTAPSKRDENWCRAMRMANGWLALFATHSSGCCAIVNIINITSALSGRHSLPCYIPKLANDAIKYGMRKKKFSPIDQW